MKIYLSQAYDAAEEKLKTEILKEKDAFILGTSTEDLVEYYYSKNNLHPILLDPEKTETFEHKKEVRLVRANDRDPMYRYDGDKEFEFESITVSIPIIHNSDIHTIKDLQTSTYTLSWSTKHVSFQPTFISFNMDIKGYRVNKSEDEIHREILSEKKHISEWIERVNSEITGRNAQIKNGIRQIVEERKKKLDSDKERLESLMQKINIPLKKKEDEAIKRIQLDPKPVIQRVRPTPTIPEDYHIDRSKVMDIIHIIDNQGRQFEKTPKTYKSSEEEDLRNVLLVGLNAVFEGKATGETFSNKGKTDIYLNINRGYILVSECKVWKGQQLYTNTIDQLLGYLTWRNNYGIMITFARNKNFTSILSEAQLAIKQHESYKTGLHQISETHFMSHHGLPTDNMKNVEIHHLFYNLYCLPSISKKVIK